MSAPMARGFLKKQLFFYKKLAQNMRIYYNNSMLQKKACRRIKYTLRLRA
jgi:hypothetical protein